MDSAHQLGAERFVNGAMALDPGHIGKDWRRNSHAEMAFAALAPAGMALMVMTFIDHLQRRGIKRRFKLFGYRLRHAHRITFPRFAVGLAAPIDKLVGRLVA